MSKEVGIIDEQEWGNQIKGLEKIMAWAGEVGWPNGSGILLERRSSYIIIYSRKKTTTTTGF